MGLESPGMCREALSEGWRPAVLGQGFHRLYLRPYISPLVVGS